MYALTVVAVGLQSWVNIYFTYSNRHIYIYNVTVDARSDFQDLPAGLRRHGPAGEAGLPDPQGRGGRRHPGAGGEAAEPQDGGGAEAHDGRPEEEREPVAWRSIRKGP